ncbi:MAG: DUF3592 domain-containing protein [Acidobacteriaceae bacterium]
MAPATASPLNRTWLRITRRDRWVPALATVDSREWTAKAGSDDAGRWQVAYTYQVDGERYVGRFVDFASGEEEYLRPGQSVAIRYNPRKPSQSYYPERQTQTPFVVLCIVTGVILAILMMVVAFGR